MATFSLTAKVFDGTSEELAQRLVAMLEGTRTTRLQANRGVVSHLVRNSRRPDIRTMLAEVGFNVTNTNPLATSLMKSFITEGDVIVTAPCHRDERGAMLVQLRGTKELLMHPLTSTLPGCLAHIFEGANEAHASRWLWDFGPFQLAICHMSSWAKVVLVPGGALWRCHADGGMRCDRRRGQWRSVWPCRSNTLTNARRRAVVHVGAMFNRRQSRAKHAECVWVTVAR